MFQKYKLCKETNQIVVNNDHVPLEQLIFLKQDITTKVIVPHKLPKVSIGCQTDSIQI